MYYVSPFPNRMPVNTTIIPRAARIIDNTLGGSPGLRSTTYEFPNEDNGFEYRSIAPRNYVPIQERLQMEQLETDRAVQQAQLTGLQARNTIARNNAQYDANINQQATAGMNAVAGLNPESDDFPAQLAELQRSYPLAFQNSGFQQSVGRLDQTYRQRIAGNEVLNRQREANQQDEDRYQTRMNDRLRQAVAQLGPDKIAKYDAILNPPIQIDPITGVAIPPTAIDPMQAYAAVYQDAIRENQEYTAEQKRQERENTALTRSDYLAMTGRMSKLLDDNSVSKGSELKGDAAQEYKFLQDQANQFITQRGGQVATATQALNPAVDAIKEGQIVVQNGQRFRKTNGKFVPIQ